MRRHRYLSDSHGARNRPDVWTESGQEANLLAVNRLVKFFDLLLLGRIMVPLIVDGGVSFGINVGGFEGFRHVDGGCCGEGSVCMSCNSRGSGKGSGSGGGGG